MQSAVRACIFDPSGRTTTLVDVGGWQARSGAGRSSETWTGGPSGTPSAADTDAIEPIQEAMNTKLLMMRPCLCRVDVS